MLPNQLANNTIADADRVMENFDYLHDLLFGDGWRDAEETWTYASASTFTISGDKTTKYQIGDKIKYTNNSVVNYAEISDISYSAPNTTVTVSAENDIANSAISLNYWSRAESPKGWIRRERLFSFLANRSSNQSVTSYAAAVKVQLNSENYDFNSDFDNATNYRWTAPVTGYYILYGKISGGATNTVERLNAQLFKNGSIYLDFSQQTEPDANTQVSAFTINGSFSIKVPVTKGDYFEMFAGVGGDSGTVIRGGDLYTYFGAQYEHA